MFKMVSSKTIVLALVVAMLISVVSGCASTATTVPAGNAQATTAAPAETTVAATSSTEKGNIAFSNKSLSYYFFVVCQDSVKRMAESLGYSFDAAVAEFDSAKQTSQFMNFIAAKPAAIVTDPIDSEGLIDAIDKAVEAGIPVAVIDTPTSGGDVAVTVAFDNKVAGEMAAEEIVKRLKDKYGEEQGTVVNVYGAMSSWAWRLRKEGFEEVIKKYPKINYVDVPGEGDFTQTQNALTNILSTTKVDAVHCPSDAPARGMAEALKTAGQWFKRGEEGHVIFVTIDGEPVANQMISEGFYDASIAQDAVSYGGIAVEMLDKYTFKGQEVPLGTYANDDYYWKECPIIDSPSGPYVAVPPYVIDDTNAGDSRHWGNISTTEWGIAYE